MSTDEPDVPPPPPPAGTDHPALPSPRRIASSSGTVRTLAAILAVVVIAGVLAGWWFRQRLETLEGRLRATSATGASGEQSLFAEPADLETFISDIGTSVVAVYCAGNGTGFAYKLTGLDPGYKTFIVTNHHVIEDCIGDPSQLSVSYGGAEKRSADVRIFAFDEDNDLALLEIDVDLPTLTDAENFASPGEWTMAIGNPGPDDEILYNATTFGRIIAVENKYWNYTSAVINPGNSGGPLVNSRGELIGINSLHSVNEETGLWNIAIDSAILCEKIVKCR